VDDTSGATEWYWDLEREMAVEAAERGKADHLLGPYPSRYEAEHWKDKVEARNKSWDESDDEWEQGAGERDR
jgi:hypothetical protein